MRLVNGFTFVQDVYYIRRIDMIINCEFCGYEYDTDDHEFCPACGDDNEEQIEELDV